MSKGWLIVYTGHGKGKTTAAFGLAFRALGRELPVAMVQFIKGKWKTGERIYAEKLQAGGAPLEMHVMGRGFTWESDDLSQDKRAAQEAWATAKALIEGGKHPVVILDELTYCFHYDFLSLDEVLAVFKARRDATLPTRSSSWPTWSRR
jgi:cob(I)alamin adenosyltransferase